MFRSPSGVFIDHFRYFKIQHGSEAYRTQTKEIEWSFLLFVSSTPHYQRYVQVWTLMRFKFLMVSVLIGKKSPKYTQFSQIWSSKKISISNDPVKYEVLIKQYLRSILDISALSSWILIYQKWPIGLSPPCFQAILPSTATSVQDFNQFSTVHYRIG